jgi:hypothetical protein
MTLAWALVGVSVVCAALLQRMLFGGIDLLEPLVPIALLHGAQLSAVLAHGLTWRRGGSSVHWAAALLTYGTTLSWMLTWCAPLQDLYAWLGNGLRLLLELGWAP